MRVTTKAVLTVMSVTGLLVGCGGDSGGTDGKVDIEHGDPKNFQIFPPAVYAGFDGVNTYSIPIQVFKNSGAVTVTVDDMSMVSLVKMNSDSTQLTYKALKAGSTMFHATAGGMTVSAPLTVTMYTPEQNATGKSRYTTGPDKDNPACQECHGAGKGPDHTPAEIDADPDEDVVNTYLTGLDPEGRPVGEEFASLLKGYKHKWKLTDAEKSGVVAYLRSLPPTGYPEYDAATAGEE
jgi:mono/diheme cytochrome c family protein